MASHQLRPAQRSDVASIFGLVEQLAVFEKAADQVQTTPAELEADLFGPEPACQCTVAEVDGKVVGIALCFVAYSTWKGRTLYLEDLVVDQAHRGQGIGKALLQHVIGTARERGYRRVAWQVLDWNQPAIDFYRSLGAELDGEWINCRLHY